MIRHRENPTTKKVAQKSQISVSDDEQCQLICWIVDVAERRDKQAFAQLFRWFAPKITRFGVKQFGNETVAQDLLQETMTRVWRKAHLFEQGKGLATSWVYTVMRNTCFDMHRKVTSKKEDYFSDDIWPLVEAENAETFSFRDHLQHQQLAHFLEHLPEAQKEVVRGMYIHELSQEQLAKQLDIPLGTVKSRLRLALAKLRTNLENHYD